MADKCAWFINLSDDEQAAQAAAQQLKPYGLPVKGQRWPAGLAWLAAAQEAVAAGAAVTVLFGSAERFADPALRRDLALFRLMVQTQLGKPVNGYTVLSGETAQAQHPWPKGQAVLDDWQPLAGSTWAAKLVARAHAPIAPVWPFRLGLHAHERLGLWLETHPSPNQSTEGAVLGVAGNQAKIDFHAVGPRGSLPARTDNQHELKGLCFQAANQDFNAWGLANTITPGHSYYTRLDGEPDILAAGTLPAGELDGVSLLHLA